MAKDGAEGVFVAALPDGRAVALKIADGAGRARAPVMVAALRALGVDLPADAARRARCSGHGEPVGEVRARWSVGAVSAPDVPSRSTTSSTGASSGSRRCCGG